MSPLRRTAALIIATAALAAPAAAQAAQHPAGARIENSSIAKPLSPEKTFRLQQRIDRTGKFPAGPRLKSNRGLERVPRQRLTAPGNAAQSEQIAVPAALPPAGKLFGFQGTYATKRDPLIQWVSYVYSRAMGELGASFRQPLFYEVGHGGSTPNGCGAVYNGMYCGSVNTIGMSSLYAQNSFNNLGDAAFAGLLAHEYGHAAQQWLRINGGNMRYLHYSEGFADCMAGGWLNTMYRWGYGDRIGRGDWQEYLDVLTNLSDTTTTRDNHGRPEWRHAIATYGWNYGMRGCTQWARQMAAA